MNESKLRKGTKYVSLKDEDVHTITGSLKQFFRELKTELIPDNIVKNLPNDLGKNIKINCDDKLRIELLNNFYFYRKRSEYILHSKCNQHYRLPFTRDTEIFAATSH